MRGEHTASEAEHDLSKVSVSNAFDFSAWKKDIEFCSNSDSGRHDAKVGSAKNFVK